MKIHGDWEITVIRQILVRSTAGIFNEEGTLAVFKETQEKAPIHAPWAGLSNAENWEMSGASSLQMIRGMRIWAFENNCAGLALVLPNTLKQKIHQQQTGAVTDPRVAYFSELAEACVWLSERGFTITEAEYPHRAFIERTRPIT
jgi:hypothetical protein